LVAAVRTARQYLTYVSAGPFPYAVAEALCLPDVYGATLRSDLLRERDLLTGPNSVFYDDPGAGRTQVRFACCKQGDVLAEAVSRLGRLV
jgi:N-succinyldiaminopimelate aminotransferase